MSVAGVCVCVCCPLCLTIIDLVKGLKLLDGTCILRNVESFCFCLSLEPDQKD